jgi:hypothetical protein
MGGPYNTCGGKRETHIKMLVLKCQEKIPHGTPRLLRCEVNIKIRCENLNWIYLAQDGSSSGPLCTL